MSLLLRVELPDVPGSLGRLATAIGSAGGDIEALEIVEKRYDGTAVDDVLVETPPGVMPDSIVSACNALDGVQVVWISRYAAGNNLFLDLEVVEELTAETGGRPRAAGRHAARHLPLRVGRVGGAGDKVLRGTEGAPTADPWRAVDKPVRLDGSTATTPLRRPVDRQPDRGVGRRGGPEFLGSELARLGHLAGLAASISDRGDPRRFVCDPERGESQGSADGSGSTSRSRSARPEAR